MPQLGADMAAGRLVAWYKQPGEVVKKGDIIAEVDTDKGAIDVEVFTSGILDKVLVQPGEKVPVGTPLAIIRDAAEVAAAPSPPPAAAPAQAAQRRRVSPVARKVAAERGVDLASVQGTGPDGAVTRADVERAAAQHATTAPAAPAPPLPASAGPPALPAPPGEADRQARMRQAIAAAVTRSKREIPHFYLSTTIDLHRATTWLAEQNQTRPVADRLLAGALLIKAVALALRDVPELNARWEGPKLVRSDAIHVGVATFLREGGLVAPALHDTDHLTLDELMRTLRDLVNRARRGELRSSELSDPTITVTSLGEQGVETVYGVIYPPQVAIVGFGKIVERPWSLNSQVVSRPVVTTTLSADHRVTDGHRGALFLAAVDARLQEPGRL